MPDRFRAFSPLQPASTRKGVTLAVLAGGLGSRMGHPKANIQVAGQPVLEYLIDRLAWPGPTLLVTAPGRQHPPGFHRFDREAIDPVSGQGPLRGLLTALEACQTGLLVMAAVDMPNVTAEHLRWLAATLQSLPDAVALLLQRTTPAGQQIEPFPSVFRSSAEKLIRQHLESGQFSLHSLSKLSEFALVWAPTAWDEPTWVNLNSPQDLSDLP